MKKTKIIRFKSNNNEVYTKGELVETPEKYFQNSNKLQLQPDGSLYINEAIEGTEDKLRITKDGKLRASEFIEGIPPELWNLDKSVIKKLLAFDEETLALLLEMPLEEMLEQLGE